MTQVEMSAGVFYWGSRPNQFLIYINNYIYIYIYIYIFFFFRYPVWFNDVFLYVFFSCVRPAVSRGSKAPPKVRQLDRQRDSGKKRRTQPIQVMVYVAVHKVANSFLLFYLHFMFSHSQGSTGS